MEYQINVSSFLPIKGNISDEDTLDIDFKQTFSAKFYLPDIVKHIRKKINDSNLEISVETTEDEEIIFEIKSESETDELPRILEDYFSYNLTKTLRNKYTNRRCF